jgi:phage-related protein
MPQTFTWRVHADASGSGTFGVNTAQFGDGYSQRVQKGINNESQLWSVTVAGFKPEVMPVLNFIRAHEGAVAFYWTPPLGERGLYVCGTYTPRDQGGGLYTLTMEFMQVFDNVGSP